MDDVVVVEDLRKEYGPVHAVDGISLTVRRGEILAMVGPNGAGKTTTVEILEGHRTRTSGKVSVLGFDPAGGGRRFRERIGIVLQEAGFDDQFSVVELVRLYTSFYPRPRSVEELIELVGLADKRNSKTAALSGGQRRRLDLALGLAGDPELLFLDEPTTGFDPSARRHAWAMVDALRDLGKTVLLTTHYMDEAEHLADRVAVVQNGKLVALGTPEELGDRATGGAIISFKLPNDVEPASLPDLGSRTRSAANSVEITSSAPTADLAVLTSWAAQRGLELESLAVARPSLEQVYLELTDG